MGGAAVGLRAPAPMPTSAPIAARPIVHADWPKRSCMTATPAHSPGMRAELLCQPGEPGAGLTVRQTSFTRVIGPA